HRGALHRRRGAAPGGRGGPPPRPPPGRRPGRGQRLPPDLAGPATMSRVERRLRKRRRRRGGLGMGVLLALAGLVVFQALQWSAARERKALPPGQQVTFIVRAGEGSVEIGRNLRAAGVVDSVNRFRDVAEERGLDGSLKPGTYKLVTGMSIDAVLDLLARGPSTGTPLTIPEGWTVAQIAARLADTKQFTRAEVDQAPHAPRPPCHPRGRDGGPDRGQARRPQAVHQGRGGQGPREQGPDRPLPAQGRDLP